MKKACLMMLMLTAFTAGAWADETPAPKTATIGGGVVHPWKSPYRTAERQVPEILPAN
jgi:hypothetical protein